MGQIEYIQAIIFIAVVISLPALIVGLTAEYIIKRLKK
jgi:hypothetical protein